MIMSAENISYDLKRFAGIKRDYTPEHIKQQQDPRHNQEPFK